MIREITMYQVVCNEPGCGFKTGDDYLAEHIAWANESQALDSWSNSEHQVTREGEHYCEDHRKVACADCGSTQNLANDALDGTGDTWCHEHLPGQESA